MDLESGKEPRSNRTNIIIFTTVPCGWGVSRSEIDCSAGRYREAHRIYLSSAFAIHLALRLPPRFLGQRPRYLVATPLFGRDPFCHLCLRSSLDTIERRFSKQKYIEVSGIAPGCEFIKWVAEGESVAVGASCTAVAVGI